MSKYTESKVLTETGARSVFLFIAELNGFKSGTIEDKLAYGKQCWYTTKLHDLNYEPANLTKEELARAEADRSEAHENIWLERIYDGLDNHYQLNTGASITKRKALEGSVDAQTRLEANPSTTYEWDIPIELDASASMLQYIGVLLDDSRLTSMTNLYGDKLSDPWAFEGIPRTQFKKAATPLLYGSSRACHELWQDGGFEYTMDQVKAFNTELANGAFGVANQFKEFLINHCKPKQTMTVKIYKDTFNIECNRFRNVGEKTTKYDIFDTETNSIRRIHHTTTKKVADLEQFRRYFVTLLIHNLDSQVANTVIEKCMDKYGWGLDIHDAFIVHPNSARDVRTWYAEEMDTIYANRKQILTDYFQSIGIGAEAQAEWNRVKAMVKPMQGFKCNRMALK